MVRLRPLLKPQQLRAAITPLLLQTQQQQQQQAAAPLFFFSHHHHHPSSTTSSSTGASYFSSSTAATAKPAQPTTDNSNDNIIPPPTPFIPDVQTFLTVIGRGLSQHASKFPSWEALFTLTSAQLQELGIEPPRTRRYLLQWRQRFRRGQFGIGGDLQHVGEDGAAELRVLETDWIGPRSRSSSSSSSSDGNTTTTTTADPIHKSRFVVNVPPGVSPAQAGSSSSSQMSRVTGYKVRGAKTIVGPYALPLKGQAGARVTVTEGMWEDRRGHKIDGGERRRTEIRYKKRIAERRELREQGLL